MAKATVKKVRVSTKDDDAWMWQVSANDKERWSTTRIPDGDIHAPFIKRLSKNSDGTYSFVVYRNQRCIATTREKTSDAGLEKAKARARSGEMNTASIAEHKLLVAYTKDTPRDAGAFKKLSESNKRTCADAYPWALPSARAMEDKGVKHVATTRTDLMGNREKAAVKSGKHNMDAVIKRIKKDGNPKKAGSIQWQRWEIVFGHDGKTVREFFAKGGDKYGLEGALELGWIKLEEK